jgi:hypothetical protein
MCSGGEREQAQSGGLMLIGRESEHGYPAATHAAPSLSFYATAARNGTGSAAWFKREARVTPEGKLCMRAAQCNPFSGLSQGDFRLESVAGGGAIAAERCPVRLLA